jgi:hypothetical protein
MPDMVTDRLVGVNVIPLKLDLGEVDSQLDRVGRRGQQPGIGVAAAVT